MRDLQTILFPTDFSACAEGAYRHAAWLAERSGATLHVLHVVEDDAAPERDWPDVPGSGHVTISLSDVCQDLGLPAPPEDTADAFDLVEVVEQEVVGRDAADAILDYVHDEDVDLVVMGTHGREGLDRVALGSVAEAVTRRAPCPVLTVRPLDASADAEWPPRRVLLALDEPAEGAPAVPPAAEWAARMAGAYGAPLTLAHVVSPAFHTPEGDAALRDEARGWLGAVAEALPGHVGMPLRLSVTVRMGDPARVLAEVADEARTHLLVVGTHGRSGAGRVMLGSVAEALVRSAPCPVLVVRDALADREPGAASAIHTAVA